MTAEGNLLATGGSEEIIKMFDLKKKKSCGELAGIHTSTITSLAISKKCNHLFSGSEDGTIVIWRVSDQMMVHQLQVKNVSKVVSLSMHHSGRMLLALYGNQMMRLWNMLDARCIFKKKAGLVKESESEKESDEDQDDDEKSLDDDPVGATSDLLQMHQRSELIRWEPTEGKIFAILFSRMLEVYSVEDNEAMHQISFDTNQTGFDFVSPTELVVSDDQGRLTYFSDVHKEEGIAMRIVETTYKRFKHVKSSPDFSFFTALTNESITFWNMQAFRDELAKQTDSDLMCEMKPQRDIA